MFAVVDRGSGLWVYEQNICLLFRSSRHAEAFVPQQWLFENEQNCIYLVALECAKSK
jgi:hypothetical protein